MESPRYASTTAIGTVTIKVGARMTYVADDANYTVVIQAIDIANRKALVQFVDGSRPWTRVRLAHLLPEDK